MLRKAPPLPFLPPAWHGREVAILAAVWAGDPVAGEKGLLPVRKIGQPIADPVALHPYVGFQKAFDPLLAPGARNYWKSHNFKSLPDAFFDTLLGFVAKLPSDQTEVFLGHLGGAANRVAATATAYPHRDTEFIMNIHGRWENPADVARCIGWARQLCDATASFASGGVYSNFVSEGDENAKATASGALASGLGYAAWYAALRGLTAAQAAIVQLAAPPLAAAGGVLFLGETLTPRLLLAGATILGGIFLAVTPPRARAGPSRSLAYTALE